MINLIIKYFISILIYILLNSYFYNFNYLKPSFPDLILIYYLIKKKYIENNINIMFILFLGFILDIILHNILGTKILFLLIFINLIKNKINNYNYIYKNKIDSIFIETFFSYFIIFILFNIFNILPFNYYKYYINILINCLIIKYII